jgi:hypothetical protein
MKTKLFVGDTPLREIEMSKIETSYYVIGTIFFAGIGLALAWWINFIEHYFIGSAIALFLFNALLDSVRDCSENELEKRQRCTLSWNEIEEFDLPADIKEEIHKYNKLYNCRWKDFEIQIVNDLIAEHKNYSVVTENI